MVTSLITFLSGPMADEFRFFLSFNLKLNMRSRNWGGHLDKDFSVYNIARLVERELSLKLHLALRENASRILKVIHEIINTPF